MPQENQVKKPGRNSRHGMQRTLEGILERLRQGLEELAGQLTQRPPQPVPIPIPVHRRSRRG
ncbi:MAG TPA: hypothetical protein DEQ80_03435 [Anaerolinea thermolimosa]|uniref:Uncharacterized protein n=1 Tax=Anaerolinea thermolimosa TaxID=229919 RepID=A0A3D1JE78_9CHLR|nr:hypothetical protein [Anaerolinea thermolimosa]GAP07330.1 hypothetical protein ATHL_02201 [Anaerolinea thermolimosa]HCE16891.1 hypothetical protein [Anaerolinea thermolimosa]